jgi:hypothetical protein
LANSRTCLFRRSFEFIALVFGLAALAVQAVAPICLSGFPAPHSTNGVQIVLCTGHGFQTITLDADGKPIPAPPARDGSDGLCQMCTAFHSTPLIVTSAAPLLVVLLFSIRENRIVATDVPVLRRAYSSFITRGPPALRDA